MVKICNVYMQCAVASERSQYCGDEARPEGQKLEARRLSRDPKFLERYSPPLPTGSAGIYRNKLVFGAPVRGEAVRYTQQLLVSTI